MILLLLLWHCGIFFPPSLGAEARILFQTQPAFAWTTITPAAGDADIDTLDYRRYYDRPAVACLGLELSAGLAD